MPSIARAASERPLCGPSGEKVGGRQPGEELELRSLLVALMAVTVAACSLSLSSSQPPQSLSSLLPMAVDGLVLEEMRGDFADQLASIARAAGGDIDEAEIATRVGEDSETSVVAVRVPGVAPDRLAQLFVTNLRDTIDREARQPSATVEQLRLGSKNVTKLTTPRQEFFVWASTDTMFYATAVDDRGAAALLRLLPPG